MDLLLTLSEHGSLQIESFFEVLELWSKGGIQKGMSFWSVKVFWWQRLGIAMSFFGIILLMSDKVAISLAKFGYILQRIIDLNFPRQYLVDRKRIRNAFRKMNTYLHEHPSGKTKVAIGPYISGETVRDLEAEERWDKENPGAYKKWLKRGVRLREFFSERYLIALMRTQHLLLVILSVLYVFFIFDYIRPDTSIFFPILTISFIPLIVVDPYRFGISDYFFYFVFIAVYYLIYFFKIILLDIPGEFLKKFRSVNYVKFISGLFAIFGSIIAFIFT